MSEYRFSIPGTPIPWSPGSKVSKAPGAPRKIPDKQAKRASDIAEVARRKCGDLWLPKGEAVRVVGHFFCTRPKTTQYGSGRNERKLKPGMPLAPTGRPDLSNLLKLVEDALTEVLWADDDQVVEIIGAKHYVDWWEQPYTVIKIVVL